MHVSMSVCFLAHHNIGYECLMTCDLAIIFQKDDEIPYLEPKGEETMTLKHQVA